MRAWKLRSVVAALFLPVFGVANAAVTLDLTSAGASGTITNNGVTATYTQVDPRPTGSGYIDPFVRIGMPGGGPGNAIMEAYNTTANVLNNSSDNTFNHEIKVGQVGFITSGGSSFMRFILDINQTHSDPLLNLDDVQIFISTTPNQDSTSFNAQGLLQLANSYLVYRQDDTDPPKSDNLVTLNYALGSGSGSGDMTLDIPQSAFNAAFAAFPGGGLTTDAAQNNAYIYLYSKFGSGANENNDGFEEWAHTGAGVPICTVPPCSGGGGGVPEPGSLGIVALGLLAMRRVTRRTH